MCSKIFKAIVLFLGWILSPFTWWNDAFVNLPISYAAANVVYSVTHINFSALILGIYWITNAAGIILMYFGGKGIIVDSRHRVRSLVLIIISIAIYSAVMIYLDRQGKLVPFSEYFGRYCTQHTGM